MKNKRNWLNSLAVLLFAVVIATGVGFLYRNDNGKEKLNAAGDGTAASPYEINSFTTFSNLIPDMARPGTAASPIYFKITAPIDMGGLNPTFTRTLANHIIIDGQDNIISNLNSSLFSNVIGPNSVIKNIKFTGTGNIAHEFSGIMDNVHHTAGSVFNLNGTYVGGLVNFSENATFRYCSNSATIRRSTAESSVVSNGGIIGMVSGSLYMTNTSNSGEILTMGTVESSGGLIGKVANQSDTVTVELSYNTGIVNGQRSGGLIGKKEGSGVLEIKESYNTGRISNRDKTLNGADSPNAGILAWATGGTVNIESCYNKGNVRIGTDTGDTSTISTNSAGIFGLSQGADVSIVRTYNTGIVQHAIAIDTSSNVSNNFVLSGVYVTLGSGVTQLSQAVLRNISTVNSLNSGLESPVFRLANNSSENEGYPVLVGEAYRFNANGGIIITESGSVDSLRFSQAELQAEAAGTGNIGNLELNRFAYNFVGWSKNAQAQPNEQEFYNFWDALSAGGGTYYAVWKAIEYKINLIPSAGFEGRQSYEANNMNGSASKNAGNDWVFVIGQNIYIQTWVNALTLDYFVGWEAKLPGATEFTPFNNGYRPALTVTPGVLSERLDFYENNTSIIDEQFINNYVDATTGTMTLIAVFTSGETFELYVDATTITDGIRQTPSLTYRNWGNLRISYDTTIHTTTFPRGERFEGTKTYTISVKPNAHYRLVEFHCMPKNDLTDVTIIPAGTADSNGYYSHEQLFNDNRVVYAILEPIAYYITVVAVTTDSTGTDTLVPSAALEGLITKNAVPYDGTPSAVTLNDIFSGITLGSNNEYKIVNTALRNYKLLNVQTNEYEFRSTNESGAISFQISSDFLEKFAVSGNIKIFAIFVKLVHLEVNVETPELGAVSIDVRDGASHFPIREVSSFDQSFGVGSSVTISFDISYQVRVKSIVVYNELGIGTSLDAKLPTIRFNLDTASRIVIEYEVRAYTMDIAAVDSEGNRFPEYPLPSIAAMCNGMVWTDEGLGLNDIITLTKESEEVWKDEWEFNGWFLIYDNNQTTRIYGNPLDELNLTGEYALEINEDFVRDYLSNGVNFAIEARFSKIFNVSISVALDNSGGANTVSGDNLVGTTRQSAYEKLMVRLTPAEYYSVAKIEGLFDTEAIESDDDGEYILINITEERHIHISYQPEQKDVVNIFTKSSGKIKINKEQIGIGTTVVIQFTPKAGYQREEWTINGISVDKIKSEYEGSNAKVSGNMVSFKITHDWYDKYGATLNSDIKITLNTFLVMGIVAIAIIIPLLIIGTILMIHANNKRKAEYLIALRKTKESKARMGFVDTIKNARGD